MVTFVNVRQFANFWPKIDPVPAQPTSI